MNCRRIIHKIIRDRLSFLLLFLGAGLLLFSVIKSLQIVRKLDDLADYDNRFEINSSCYFFPSGGDLVWSKEEGEFILPHGEPTKEEWEAIARNMIEQVSRIESDETAIQLFARVNGVMDYVHVYLVFSKSMDNTYLKKYKNCENSDVYITGDLLSSTTKEGKNRYISIDANRRYKVGGEYTFNGIGNPGRVVILWDRLSEEDKEYYVNRIINNITVGLNFHIKSDSDVSFSLNKAVSNVKKLDFDGKFTIDYYAYPSGDEEKYDRYVLINTAGRYIFITFSVINLFVILIVWIRRHCRDIAIRRIWGEKNGYIAFVYLKEILITTGLSVLFSFVLELLYAMYFRETIMGYISKELLLEALKYVGLIIVFTYMILLAGVNRVNYLNYIRES